MKRTRLGLTTKANETSDFPDASKFKRANAASTASGIGSETKVSNFLITINTNKVAPSEMSYLALVDRLGRDIGRFFEKSVNWLMAEEPDAVGGREVYVAIEQGPHTGRVHAHILARVFHSTKTQVNIPNLRVFFNNLYGYRFYINVKAWGGPLDFGKNRTIEYITKKINEKK